MAHDSPYDVVGAGWSFPLRFDGRGGLALSRGSREIEEAMRIIVGTPVGTRLNRPEFGCRIHELIFAPINAVTMAAAERYVQEALAYWEPRIDVLAVTALPDPQQDECLLITILYQIRATHDERSLVFPFYTIPGEE